MTIIHKHFGLDLGIKTR